MLSAPIWLVLVAATAVSGSQAAHPWPLSSSDETTEALRWSAAGSLGCVTDFTGPQPRLATLQDTAQKACQGAHQRR